MTTTIVPGIGQGAVFTQQGAGASPGYAAIDVRRADSLGVQEGVVGPTDFMVVQRGAGANMSVDITMTAGGQAVVQGDSVNGQGLYTVPVHSATVNETIAAADPTNPRVDQVILEIQDNVHDASGGNLARIRVLTGTPTGGANLTNRTGAAALPGSALLLADVLVVALDTSITNSEIRDRRKWARGAKSRHILTTADATGSGTTQSATGAGGATFSPALPARIECSGVMLIITTNFQFSHSVGGGRIGIQPFMDGAVTASTDGQELIFAGHATAANLVSASAVWQFVPAAGSHTFDFGARCVDAGTRTLKVNLVMTIEEAVRQNTPNNATTSG